MASLIQDLVNKLEKTNVRNDTPEGVSFAKRSLKLDSEKDGKFYLLIYLV